MKLSFNTASGKYCCNIGKIEDLTGIEVNNSFNTASGKYCCNVIEYAKKHGFKNCFNTASGKYCCNLLSSLVIILTIRLVSIPQAVSTVATLLSI